MHYRIRKSLDTRIFKAVSQAGREMGCPVYVVGGYVRDLIMDRRSTDIDFVVVGSGMELAERTSAILGKDEKVTYFKNFGTAMFKYGAKELEFVGARKESYRESSRKPIVENGSLEDDQKRRDFTVNAMSVSLNMDDYGELIDPFNGLQDMKDKLIRTPLDPAITFSDDPLRMIRAIRFACQLGFSVHPDAFDAIKEKKDRLGIISMERISAELDKIIMADVPSVGFKMLMSSGLLNEFFQEMVDLKGAEYKDGIGHKDNFLHTLEVLDNLSGNTNNIWLRWAAILHDIGKPPTKNFQEGAGWTFHTHEFVGAKMVPRIFKKFKLPLNDHMRYVKKLVLLHLRPIALTEDNVTDSAIRRLLFEAGDDIDDLMMLCESDITSKNPAKVKRYMKNFTMVREKLKEIEEKDRVRNFQPPVSGELIISTFGIKPGREVGIIKNAIKDAILDGEISNDFNEAFVFMINKGEKLGLQRVKDE